MSESTSTSPVQTRVVIGVAGGTGSGKTTVARNIVEALGAEACSYIDLDAYYHDLAHLEFAERARTNFDDPGALESEMLCGHVDALRNGQPVDKPVYDFASHTRSSDTVRVAPTPVLVVEGIHVLSIAELRSRLDIRIFVDTDADIRVLRRIRRDLEERGRTLDDIEEQYLATVRPMHLAHVEPSRRFADLIIPEGGENQVAIGMVIGALRQLEGANAQEVPTFDRST